MKALTSRFNPNGRILSVRVATRTSFGVLAAATALAMTVPAVAPAQAGSTKITTSANSQRVKLGLNKSIVIDLPMDAYDILVANPEVADAVTRTAKRIYLFGKQVGETNIFVFGPNGQQIANLDLSVERDVAGLEEQIKRFIPDSHITAELINDNVVLSGSAQTPMDAQRAAQIAEIFVTGGEATTGQYAQTASGGDNGGVAISNPDSTRRSSKIVNLIQIIGEDQVTLKVTVAEISRAVMKQLGVNMLGSGSADGITWSAISQNLAGLGKALSASGGALGYVNGATSIQSYLTAMEQAGVMKTLSEPTLTAVSGEKAEFRVGGEFNLVTGQSVDPDTNQVSYDISKIEYGIGLEFLPVVLSPGRISLKIRTAVSEPTSEGSVPLSAGIATLGTNMISIRKRLADTTVELPSGGSMMIAGLVRDDVRQVVSGMPGISKVPVLGTLFRSRDFVHNETELVVIVTPYLARPVARNELAKPDDNFNAASDSAGYVLGRVNRVYGTMQTKRPPGRYHGVVGFIYK